MDDLQAFYDQLELNNCSQLDCARQSSASDFFLDQLSSIEKKDEVYISELIGSGGQKKIYKAQLGDGQEIAVATINESDCSWSVEKLCKEACITKRLRHPHILEVHDYGYDVDFGPYIAMPLVEGENLVEYLMKEKNIHKLIDVLIQTSKALSFAHNRDVYHGDIKAENILITGSNHVYLIDWGSAHALPCITEDFSLNPLLVCASESSIIWGTMGSIPPEISSSKEIDEKTDIYQFGIMLKEILSSFPDSPHKRFLIILASKASLRKPANRFDTVREILHELESLPESRSGSYFNLITLGISALLAFVFCIGLFINDLNLDGSFEEQFKLDVPQKRQHILGDVTVDLFMPIADLGEDVTFESVNDSEE